jgi:Dockerin type I domain
MKAIAKVVDFLFAQLTAPRSLPVVVILLTISLFPPGPALSQILVDEQEVVTNGDLNLDGEFNMLDLIQLERTVYLDVPLSDEKIQTCDVDGDLKLTNYDLLVMADAFDVLQEDGIEIFDAIDLSIRKDASRGGDNVEAYLDLARFYRKEKKLERSKRVLSMILETLDTRHPLYELVNSTMTLLDNEEEALRLMNDVSQSQDLFRAEDDPDGKLSLRSMVHKMQDNLSNMLEGSQFASNYNSKKVKAKLNAVMENMLHKLGRDQMLDPADYTLLKGNIQDVLEDPNNLVQDLTVEQRNRLFGEVDRSTENMRSEAMRIRQQVEKRRAEQEKAAATRKQEQMALATERLDRREGRMAMQREEGNARTDQKIIASSPKLTPDTVSVVAPGYVLEWDVSNVLGAKRVGLEISHADQKFQNRNGNMPDEENQYFWSATQLTTISGKLNLNATNLEGLGVYQFRVAALDMDGELMSKFSDAVNLVMVFNNVNTIANKPIIEPEEVPLDNPQYTIRWDVSNVEGAYDAAVEISKPDAEFSNPNGRKPDRVNQAFFNGNLGNISSKLSSTLSGSGGEGTYLFRVGATSSQGDFIGRWSDPAILVVKKQVVEQPPEETATLVPPVPQVSLLDTAVTISWNLSDYPRADGILLEIVPEKTDSDNPGNKYNLKIIGIQGSHTVNSSDLNGEGACTARIAAIDNTGSILGLWSPPVEFKVYNTIEADLSVIQENTTPMAQASGVKQETASAGEDSSFEEGQKLVVKRKTATLYKEKSLSSPEIATLNQGEILLLREANEYWYKVALPGKRQKGWVFKNDVELFEK